MRNNDITTILLAASAQALFRVSLDVDLEPVFPAAPAKLVAATKFQRHAVLVSRLLGGIEVSVADHAVATIISFLARVKCRQLLLVHSLFDIGVEQDASVVLELRLVGEPALRH